MNWRGEGGAGQKTKAWPVLTTAEWCPGPLGGQPPFCQAPTAFSCPGKGFSANQCHGIKSDVKGSLVCEAPLLGDQGSSRPLGPRTRDVAQAPPPQLSWGHRLLETSCQFQGDSQSWPHGRLMPAPHSG